MVYNLFNLNYPFLGVDFIIYEYLEICEQFVSVISKFMRKKGGYIYEKDNR